MLVVLGGLPGKGKTTISRSLAARRAATYLRIDVIEQALRTTGVLQEIGAEGYEVASALAKSNLENGQVVVADCVNSVRESREGWRVTAACARKPLIEVEVICSNLAEHRRRVEQRASDIDGLDLPTWQDVLDRDYAPWPEPHVIIDTARLSPDEAIAIIEQAMAAHGPHHHTHP